MHEQKLGDYGIESSIENRQIKRQIINDENFLKAFVPYVIHDSELDTLYDNINDFSFNVGHGNHHQSAILGFKYQGLMFFTANFKENRSLLNYVGFKEDKNIVLPYKSVDTRDTAVHVGDNSIESNFRLGFGIHNITLTHVFANSHNQFDQVGLGSDFWCKKKNLERAINNQIMADSNAMIEYVKGHSL